MGKGAEGVRRPTRAPVLAAVPKLEGYSAPKKDSWSSKFKFTPHRLPVERPPFTRADLKRAIPPHCFQRKLATSMYYLGRDIIQVAIMFYIGSKIDSTRDLLAAGLPKLAVSILWSILAPVLWLLYFFFQAISFSNLWVIAHECGHGGFSDYQAVNDTIGLIIHSWLFVPYWSWKYSHNKHHKYNGSMQHDEVFVPRHKPVSMTYFLKYPFVRGFVMVFMLLIGWPLYLVYHQSGPDHEGIVCHFNPWSNLYKPSERLWVHLSNLGIAAVIWSCFELGKVFGSAFMVKMYVGPLFFTFFDLGFVTWLHHTHVSLPHFEDNEWEWLRGQLATVDRDWGFMKYVGHDITTTHVVHHLFPNLPHYHAMEATNAIKPILGPYYIHDSRPILGSAWTAMLNCQFAAPDPDGPPGIRWFQKIHFN